MKQVKPFRFKQFEIYDDECAMKVGTDGVLLGAWADVSQDKKILDVGTGSGLIALMIAQRNPNAQIVGIEIDSLASQQAITNALQSPWAKRVEIKNIAFQDFAQQTETKFKHIISNPPYFEVGTLAPTLERNQARQTYSLTFLDLILNSKKILDEDGKLSVILPLKESENFTALALNHQFSLCRKWNVKPKKEKKVERVLLEFSLSPPESVKKKTIIIQHQKRNDWTEEYKDLTRAFYLKI